MERIGGLMFRWVATLLALGAAAPAAAECRMVRLTEIRVRVEDGRAVISVTSDQRKLDFVFASGSADSRAFRDATTELGWPEYEVDQSGLVNPKGPRRANYVQPARLSLGPLRTRGIEMRVVERPWGYARSIVGVLSPASFGDADIELDLAHGVLRLFRAEGCTGDDAVYWGGAYSVLPLSPGGAWRVPAAINGRPASATVASEIDTSRVSPESPAARDLAGARQRARLVIDAIVLDQETLRHTPVEVGPAPDADGQTPDLALGLDFLRSHRVMVSPRQHRMYLTYNRPPPH